MRRRWRWLAAGGLVAAIGGHAWYWYAPRLRPGAPSPGGLTAAVYADGRLPLRLWVAWPHQNLGSGARAVGDWQAWLAAGAHLAGVEAPRWPGFGPFLILPSREMAVATDDRGEQLEVALAAFPSVAGLARMAGWLAGNPWLAGGEVPWRKGKASVAWRGATWTFSSSDWSLPAASAQLDPTAALARLRVDSARPWLPAGEHFVTAANGVVAIGSPQVLPKSPLPAGAETEGLAFAVVEDEGAGRRSLLAWQGQAGELPGLASAVVGAATAWPLPGASLFALAGRELPRGTAGEWRIESFDRSTVRRAERLLTSAAPSFSPAAGAGRWLWLEPGVLHRLAIALERSLRAVPLLGERESRRWREVATLLAPFQGCGPLFASVAGPSDPAFSALVCGSRGLTGRP